jgi:hypothetical protein
MYAQRNIEARCCSGKAINITYSECAFVALCIQLAMRMRHIIVCSRLYLIFPHYLINGTIFGGKNFVEYTECPTRYRTRHFFNNSNTN